jgi:hypothetical protein
MGQWKRPGIDSLTRLIRLTRAGYGPGVKRKTGMQELHFKKTDSRLTDSLGFLLAILFQRDIIYDINVRISIA